MNKNPLDAKRLYLAGPMSNHVDFNRPAFRRAAKKLRSVGYEVINPAEFQHDYPGLPAVDWERPSTFTNAHYRRALLQGFRAIVGSDEVDAIDGLAYLDGWANSHGARAEVYLCHTLGIPTHSWERWFSLAFSRVRKVEEVA